MCAINGFNFKDEALVKKMNQVTAHRGPDGTGFFVGDGVSLGHNRLSIIDLSEQASQPMFSFDNAQIIVFNGEIYNFLDLKKELENSYPFKTKSDTEVILAAYRKWGNNCVKKLNGIFSFVIWDKSKKELFMARDHIGIKPFYYFHEGENFIFSSEIKAILEHPIKRFLNHEAMCCYFRVLYSPEPLTMFEGIHKLPPASFAVLKNNSLKIEKYWSIDNLPISSASEKELEEKLREIVLKSVSQQLISDKPLGLYLSSGIDSSIVLDGVCAVRGKVDTFSVGFELESREDTEKFNQDFYLAKKTAEFYKTNHNEVMISSNDAVELFEKSVWHIDEPISNPTSLTMLKLAGFAKKKVDVVLSGDGGDELFGGYERYRLSLASSYYQKLPFYLRKVLRIGKNFKKLNVPAGVERFALFMFQKDKVLSRFLQPKFLDNKAYEFFDSKYFKNTSAGKSFEEIFMDIDRQSWLVDEDLARADKMSMAYGLENRVPLLNKDLVEFSASIPFKYKVGLSGTKLLFKKSFSKRIPEFLLNQPKRGWFSPGAKWLRNEKFRQMAEEMLSENYYSETARIFNWDGVKEGLKAHIEKQEYNFIPLWSILCFQNWARQYKIHL